MYRAILISLIFSISITFASGAYDHGTAAGKGNIDISLTWNPFNYFKQGQSYAIFGYGISDRFDFHGYYSRFYNGDNNYYYGLFYQLYQSRRLDLSTAIGFRKYNNQNTTHLFIPQLLYTIYLTEKMYIGGSFVDIRSKDSIARIGTAVDIFLIFKIFEKKNYEVDFTIGGFNPVLWEPNTGNWYPTYSIDIKIKPFLFK